MAALKAQAVTTNQGDSSICVCAALAMAATDGGQLNDFLSLRKYFFVSLFLTCFFVSLQHSMTLASTPHKENCSLT